MINPTISWSQTEYILKLRIQVDNPFKPPIISFDEKHLKLIPEAFNIEEVDTLYKLQFYDSVVPERSLYRIGVNEISYEILKSQPGNWPRLLATMDYCPFLQEEFTDDYSVSNDSDLYEDGAHGSPKSTQNSFRKLRPKNFGRRKKQSITAEEIKRIYLFLYNLFQFVGFIYVLVVLSIRFAKEGADSTHGSYKTLGIVIKLLYITQIQEVIHNVMDKSRKGTQFLFLHLAFRYFILFIMIDSEPRIQTQLVVFNLLLIYTLMELIKYPYYMLRSFNVSIGFLTWIRCTTWLLLYPLAFLCEAVVMFKNLAYFEETELYSLYLPNQLNFSFHLPSFIRCYLLLGLFPFLYLTIVRLYYYRLNIMTRKPAHLCKID